METWTAKEYQEFIKRPVKKHKYNAKKFSATTSVNGKIATIKFDSQKEATRGIELYRLERSGLIKNLELQPRFLLVEKEEEERAVYYTADFKYFCCKEKKWIVEDVKSPITKKNPDYIIKRKIFKQKYPQYEFVEYL